MLNFCKASLSLLLLLQVTNVHASDFDNAAKTEFYKSSAYNGIEGEHEFKISLQFPDTLADKPQYSWELIDFRTEPENYMNAVLQHILSDTKLIDNDFDVAKHEGWHHAPWLRREPLRGLTAERRSQIGELWPSQQDGIQNWAVSFYNERGSYTIGKVWEDYKSPDPTLARFSIGTLGFKLLFTAATSDQVPYLSGSKTWNAKLSESSANPTPMKLLQLDIVVRDARADSTTGWVFGTFMYYDPSHSKTDFSWSQMLPVSLSWGADPKLLGFNYQRGEMPLESWTNPVIKSLFDEIRSEENGFATSNLGMHGRANGPVDNPNSSCHACHSRAIDFGESKPRGFWNAVLPFAPLSDDRDFTLQWFFRNLKPNDPYLHDTVSLDYSLQLQVGIKRFRDWERRQSLMMGNIQQRSIGENSGRSQRLEMFLQERGGE